MAKRRNNTVRIIGGRWRGRRLRFPAVAAIRPTADRLRETLFNWTVADIDGARCLDLFAGSGALAFEAASRGAAHVTAVDASRDAVRALARNKDALGAGDVVELVQARASAYLERPVEPVDLVFVDPPFARPDLADEALAGLVRYGWLRPNGRVYLEVPVRGGGSAPTPANWHVLQHKAAGDAKGMLLCRADGGAGMVKDR